MDIREATKEVNLEAGRSEEWGTSVQDEAADEVGLCQVLAE